MSYGLVRSGGWHRLGNIERLGWWWSWLGSGSKSTGLIRRHTCNAGSICWSRCSQWNAAWHKITCFVTGKLHSMNSRVFLFFALFLSNMCFPQQRIHNIARPWRWFTTWGLCRRVPLTSSVFTNENSILFSFSVPSKLFDRISCTVMSPSRAPPGDAVSRSRDTIDAILSASGHKYGRERNELLQLLSLPHLQVCYIYCIYR